MISPIRESSLIGVSCPDMIFCPSNNLVNISMLPSSADPCPSNIIMVWPLVLESILFCATA